jgi:hypothetical protein
MDAERAKGRRWPPFGRSTPPSFRPPAASTSPSSAGPTRCPAFLSKDGGESWERRDTPFPAITVGQKAASLKLRSGALLLVSFDSKQKPVTGGSGEVFAALSFDDGATWPHVRRIENLGGYMSLWRKRRTA